MSKKYISESMMRYNSLDTFQQNAMKEITKFIENENTIYDYCEIQSKGSTQAGGGLTETAMCVFITVMIYCVHLGVGLGIIQLIINSGTSFAPCNGLVDRIADTFVYQHLFPKYSVSCEEREKRLSWAMQIITPLFLENANNLSRRIAGERGVVVLDKILAYISVLKLLGGVNNIMMSLLRIGLDPRPNAVLPKLDAQGKLQLTSENVSLQSPINLGDLGNEPIQPEGEFPAVNLQQQPQPGRRGKQPTGYMSGGGKYKSGKRKHRSGNKFSKKQRHTRGRY